MLYFTRDIEQQLRTHIDDNKVVVLTGMRRVGKTSLLRELSATIQNKVWFDFENPLDVKIFEGVDYNDTYERIIVHGRLDRNKRVSVFVDEVQLYPEISKIAKYLYDHYDVKFFLTGSASYYLKNLFPESLAGRKVVFELYPLSFREFVLFRGGNIARYDQLRLKKQISLIDCEQFSGLYSEFLRWGGFPEIVLAKDEVTKRELALDIFSSYYQKEVVQLGDWSKQGLIRDLMVLLAARVGSLVDVTKLSQELGTTRVTLSSYLAFLEATYFISFASRFSKSSDRAVAGLRKVYLCDNGIMRVIAETTTGMQLENAVYQQLARRSGEQKIAYYRTERGKEIDFVLGQKELYEVKRTATKSDVMILKRMQEVVKMKHAVVVSEQYVEEQGGVVFAAFL